ncbi:MAG: TetR/AcrR family transcriptional regulator [Acidimicrobiia bacterium]|nr:TetR/AcrR family transcriptional regulator [Acidimicrobiia bacterium]
MTPGMDRPAAVRRALRDLVAERGFHGASMGAVAKEAGVATGTAYTHYESKDELVYATYLEIKAGLSAAVLEDLDASASPFDQWNHMLTTAYDYLSEQPERARFLSQLEESPYYEEAHARLAQAGDPLVEAAQSQEFRKLLIDLPDQVIYALSLGVAVRLIAAGIQLKAEEVDNLVSATWRAVTRP